MDWVRGLGTSRLAPGTGCLKRKEKKSFRFSAIIAGASRGGSLERCLKTGRSFQKALEITVDWVRGSGTSRLAPGTGCLKTGRSVRRRWA